VREVDLVSEVVSRFGRGPQGVHSRGYDRAGGFLVIEDGEGGRDEDGEKDGDSAHPAHTTLLDI